MLLNTQPLSAVHAGGIPDTNREAKSRKAVRLTNVPGAALVADARWAVLAALWGLFDARSLPILLRTRSRDGSMPGAVPGESAALRTAEVIHHHIQLVSHSYPDAVNRSQFVSDESLVFLLSEPSVSPLDAVVTEIAQNLQAAGVAVNPVNALALYQANDGKNKRKRIQDNEGAATKKRRYQPTGGPEDLYMNDGAADDDWDPTGGQ